MPACAYHFTAKTIGRTHRQSAVAAVAYRTGARLHDDRQDRTFDYHRRQGVGFVYHGAPKEAPAWAHKPETAWNEVERAETRVNSNVAREYEVSFPHQLDAKQREYLLKDFLREEFTRKGFLVTAAIHAPSPAGNQKNHHAHIVFSDRPLGAVGFNKNKDHSFAGYATRVARLDAFKDRWAALCARQLARAGFNLEAERWRHGHKTLPQQKDLAGSRGDTEYAEQCAGQPTTHIGVHATAMERKGQVTERGSRHRQVQVRNTLRQDEKVAARSVTKREQPAELEAAAQTVAVRAVAPVAAPPGASPPASACARNASERPTIPPRRAARFKQHATFKVAARALTKVRSRPRYQQRAPPVFLPARVKIRRQVERQPDRQPPRRFGLVQRRKLVIENRMMKARRVPLYPSEPRRPRVDVPWWQLSIGEIYRLHKEAGTLSTFFDLFPHG